MGYWIIHYDCGTGHIHHVKTREVIATTTVLLQMGKYISKIEWVE